MEISMFEMWLFFTFLPDLGTNTAILGFLGIIAAAVLGITYLIVYSENDYSTADKVKTYIKYVSIASLICILCASVAPSKQEMAAIIVVPAITQNKSLQDLGTAGTNMLTEQFKQWTKELMTENKKEKSSD